MNHTRRRLAPTLELDLSQNALQEVGEMTQMKRKSVPMRGLILLLAMFLGAGLVLSGCGDDDTATTPAPAPPPPPPPAPEPEPEPEPEPVAPSTPTGLHVDEDEPRLPSPGTGARSKALPATWCRRAWTRSGTTPDTVLFDGAPFTVETHYTATDLPPGTTVYVRVAAAAGTIEAPLVSAFTDPRERHVGDTSAAGASFGSERPRRHRVGHGLHRVDVECGRRRHGLSRSVQH